MTNRKGLVFFLSLVLLLCFAVPGTLAVADGADEGGEGRIEIVDAQENIGGELPVEEAAEEEQEIQADAEDLPAETIDVSETDETPGLSETSEPDAENAPAGELSLAGTQHIEGCDEDCASEDCACSCHEPGLFDRLMACMSIEEIEAMFEQISEDEFLALTEEELAKVEALVLALEPEPLPAVAAEASEPPVKSEIVVPAVSFTNAAPLGDPVVGGAN